MAETGPEYKDALLFKLNQDADLAEWEIRFLTQMRLPFAETDAIREMLLEKIRVAEERKEFCTAAALALADVDAIF